MVFNNDFERECIETGRDIPKRDIQEMMIEVKEGRNEKWVCVFYKDGRKFVTPRPSSPSFFQEMRYFRPSNESLAKMSQDRHMVYDDRK
jgi:hypothetical protein